MSEVSAADESHAWEKHASRTGVPKPIVGTLDWHGERDAHRSGFVAGAEWQASRKDSLTVRTVADLDALPVGALIEAHRKAIYRRRRGAWSNLDGADRFQPNVGWLPATVLWTPEEATR